MNVKRILTIILAVVLIQFISLNVLGDKSDVKYIRVGLKNPMVYQDQAVISTNNGFVICTIDNGFNEILKTDAKSLFIRLDDFYKIEDSIKLVNENEQPDYGPYHLEIKGEYKEYDDVEAEIINLKDANIKAYPYYNGKFRIWLGFYKTYEEALTESELFSEKLGKKINVIDNSNMRIVIEDNKGNVLLVLDPDAKLYIKSNVAEGYGSIIAVNGSNYRDYLTLNRIDKELIIINYLPLEHYLYGVVPREMSANWPLEALKAQAVAARNYALISLKRHDDLGYDLCDTQHCQVYAGYDWENIKSNKAVDETYGKVLKYNGKLVNAYFHSTSGGHTENSENVWEYEIPYLRGVKDDFSIGSPNYSWQLVLNNKEIKERLEANDISIGDICSVEPLARSEYGRVLELKIEGTDGVEILKKENSRKVFGYASLKSTWFDVKSDADVYVVSGVNFKPVKTTLNKVYIVSANGMVTNTRSVYSQVKITNGDKTNIMPVIPNMYVFEGRGWGHGVGMSQWGAKKMAELGYNYKQILEYYYTGAKVE
ncbi:stage II sporulation protein D [Caloranaerobacter azorensis DSM 13643]|uniref:Stage II sporulation protein D n=1 Tax=Caloranaerobacter azorensis DSM 13643 TaxID=1121264 RepID=A0A1M5TRH1_9FIRM|nr:SpoIID/LytB domain-containing protein [Caloranaerobacter azorensis]SHH53268.1 stage II sporulation protein D [Caloranaerobacter azorensis DSM 13643]